MKSLARNGIIFAVWVVDGYWGSDLKSDNTLVDGGIRISRVDERRFNFIHDLPKQEQEYPHGTVARLNIKQYSTVGIYDEGMDKWATEWDDRGVVTSYVTGELVSVDIVYTPEKE